MAGSQSSVSRSRAPASAASALRARFGVAAMPPKAMRAAAMRIALDERT